MKRFVGSAVVLIALTACSTMAPEATKRNDPGTVAPGGVTSSPPVRADGSGAKALAPKLTLIEGQLVSASPSFSFALPQGWRLATAADSSRFEIYQHAVGALNEQGRRDFERRVGSSATRLTNATGAFVGVTVTENKTTRFQRGYQMNAHERDLFWNRFSRTLIEGSPENNKPVLTFRSVEVKDYPDSPAVVLVYVREDSLGTVVWTIITFFSESFSVGIGHAAIASNPTNGLDGLEAIVRSFGFFRQ